MPVVLDRLRSLRVADVMSRRVVCVSARDKMDEAAERFVREEVSGVPVVDDMERCVGILSALDFVRRSRPGGMRAGDLSAAEHCLGLTLDASWDDRVATHMSASVQSVKSFASLTDAARIMSLSHVHRLPVLDDRSRPVGIISALDIVSAVVVAADEADEAETRRSWEREIKEEHAALHRRIKEVRDVLAQRSSMESPGSALLGLCREAKQHFEHEEEGGYFAEVLARAPRLTAQAERLHAQHGELFGKLRALAEAARQGTAADKLREQFEPLARSWLEHEADENRLMLAAFDEDVGAAD